MRQALEAAADDAFTMLPMLEGSRLVEPGMDTFNRTTALDAAVVALDALDADPNLEEELDDEAGGDDELSLGWREAVRQLDLGHASDDGEPTLGAPERDPWVISMGRADYEPADGSRPWRGFASVRWNQVRWAQGSRHDGEGEACVGYDLGEDSTPDEDGFRRPWLDADRVFGLRVKGDCCAPHILDSGAVHVDKEAEPVAGDFVAIFFEGWRDNRYGMHRG